MDFAKAREDYATLLKDLELDKNRPLHRIAARAFANTFHLHSRGKKTLAKKYAAQFDMIFEKSAELAELIEQLHPYNIEHLARALDSRIEIADEGGNDPILYLSTLSEAAKLVRSEIISPIPDGSYNPFIFYFVNDVLGRFYAIYAPLDEEKLPQKQFLDALTKYWVGEKPEVSKIATQVIALKLKSGDYLHNLESAQRTVANNIDIIADERISRYSKY